MMQFTDSWRGVLLVLGLVTSLGCDRAFAEAPLLSLTIEQAVETSLKGNASLAREAIDLAGRRRQSAQAFSGILPTVSLSTGLSRNNFPTDSGSGDPIPWTNSNTLGVVLNLAPSNWAEIETAKVNAQMGQITFEGAQRSLEKSVRMAFYGLLLQQATLHLEEQSLERISNQYLQIVESHRAGLVSDLDVMTVQVTMLASQPAVEALRVNLIKQKAFFCQLLGVTSDREIVLLGDLRGELPTGGRFSPPLGHESSDLAAARANLEGVERIRAVQRWSRWLPTASLAWTLSPSRTGLMNPATGWTDSTGGLSLGLSFTLNHLLPWSPVAETLAQSDDQIRKYQTQIAELEETQKLVRKNSLLQIQQSLHAIGRLDETAALAERTYTLSREAYQKGAKDWLSLQSIEGEMQKARFNALSERYNLRLAVLAFENDEGLPFGTLMGGQK